jgi:crotonobetainyl-CoA:carnitine CoA-transferase CaiB-like acyl-CoA transferase
MSALTGVRVLELGEGIAPSIVGMFFADFGADVIKVEGPDGDPGRSNPGFPTWNRGKRSVIVDPGSESDRAWLAQSILGADVCIVGGDRALGDWGEEVAQAAASNGALVVTKMPPYLPSSTPWFGGHESAALLSAFGGMAARQSSEDGTPVELVQPFLVYVHGAWATVCTVAALVERQRSGFGQTVTVSGTNAVQVLCAGSMGVDPNDPDPNTASGNQGRHPSYRAVRAEDGWMACGALGPKFERATLEVLGISDILDDPRLAGQTENLVLPDNIAWSTQQVADAFATKPRDYWVQALSERGIPAGPLLRFDEWLDHPQVMANGLRAEVDDPERGTVVMPGVPVTLTKTPGTVHGPAPRLGQDNAAKLEPWPALAQPTGKPSISAGPLSHIRVLNMGTFVASPYAGFLFCELGADVVKVEPPTGDPFRATAFTSNRGMRSLAIDLQSDTGRKFFHAVARDVDVVTDGMRPGVMTKLGIDYPSLQQVNPDIITVSLAAFGMHGELASAGGVDLVLQAMSGMMLAQGEDENPVNNSVAVLDMTTASLTVLASVLALYHRGRTGEGQRAWDSLMGTSTFMGLGELTRFAGRPTSARGGNNYKGRDPLDRFYQVSDGWVRVQAPDPASVSTEGLKQAGIVVEDLSVAALTDALAYMSGADAVAAFTAAGVCAVRARRVSELFHDQELLDDEFVHFRRADDGSTIATTARHANFSRTRRQGPLTPPGAGEHTVDVLRQAHVPDTEITRALSEGLIAQGGRFTVVLRPIYR